MALRSVILDTFLFVLTFNMPTKMSHEHHKHFLPTSTWAFLKSCPSVSSFALHRPHWRGGCGSPLPSELKSNGRMPCWLPLLWLLFIVFSFHDISLRIYPFFTFPFSSATHFPFPSLLSSFPPSSYFVCISYSFTCLWLFWTRFIFLFLSFALI